MLSKEAKKELEAYKLELKKKELERKTLLEQTSDWGALEEFIQKCNTNPNLHIKITLTNGTIINMVTTVPSNQKLNPLFTDEVYDEDN